MADASNGLPAIILIASGSEVAQRKFGFEPERIVDFAKEMLRWKR